MRNGLQLLAGAFGALTMAVGCWPEPKVIDGPSLDAATSRGSVVLRISEASNGVDGFRITVEQAGEVVTTRTVEVEEESLPPDMLPGAGDSHSFGDAYFVLPPGKYTVRAEPLIYDNNELIVDEGCAPAVMTDVEVVAAQTAEILLVAQCNDVGSGGLDVIATTNYRPVIVDLHFDPSKFVETCETLVVTLTATDRDGDAITYAWEVTGPDNANFTYSNEGPVLTFQADTAGSYAAVVTACDSLPAEHRACDELSFPIYVADCGTESHTVVLQPATGPVPVPQTLEAQRQIARTGVLFTIDPSESMQDEQRNMACAVKAFGDSISDEARYSIGVVTQNTTCHEWTNGDMNGTIPPLVGLQDPSCAPVYCSGCGSSNINVACSFNNSGTPITEATPNGLRLLKRTVVLDGYRDEYACSGDGNGDEASFTPAVLRALDAIESGQPAAAIVVAASDESADDDGEACKWVARNYASSNRSWFSRVLVDFDPPPRTGSCHQDLSNFYSYFFSTYGCHHDPDGDGIINPEVPNPNPETQPCTRVFSLCKPSECDIQENVANATGGSTWDIDDCPFDDFFAQVGLSTSTLSTAICGVDTDDPSSLEVTYVGSGGDETVPARSVDGVNGWTYDTNLSCVDLHGSWAPVEGQFRVSFTVLVVQPQPRICFPTGTTPIADSIEVRHQSATGPVIPQSATEGWTFDGSPSSACLDLHGSWALMPKVEGPFHVEYFAAP